MPSTHIPFRDTRFFSELICDYLDESKDLKGFYSRFPNLEAFGDQIKEKQKNYDDQNRLLLEQVLLQQYKDVDATLETHNNIVALGKPNTFTITTGHQLNLFTGPLYFLYKIISTIKLTRELNRHYSPYHFVPVYWMATEDHDFEEINFFNFGGKKVQWSRETSGAVGRLDPDGLDEVFSAFASELGSGKNAAALKSLFRSAYLENKTLADATRYIANELFGEYGLVVVDADSVRLKKPLVPYMLKEVSEKKSQLAVLDTNSRLRELGYKIQVNPRPVNLFYLKDDLRERILESGKKYAVNNTDLVWTEHELMEEIKDHPDHFSPNVIMRPLYQEVLLPNLCYIGGGGELAYWLQLKSYFDEVRVTYPMLLLRNSALLVSTKHIRKLEKLDTSIVDLFNGQAELIALKTRLWSNIKIDFSHQKRFLKKQFEELFAIAEKTDKSFTGAVSAQQRKQIKGLEHLEKRLLKAEKRNLKDKIDRLTAIQNDLFPGQSLQERQKNFSEFFVEYGDNLIPFLFSELDPFNIQFSILELTD